MKQRIITAVIAAALFIPFVVYGQWPFALLVYAMAAVGLYEILKMKGIAVFSVPGILGALTLFTILLPKNVAGKVLEITSYTKFELLIIGVILLLVYSVIVKNHFTFDDVAFVILST